jgi:short-subunit dehydrogenase involved in D-alanine esterification of teichoic acids
MGGERFQNPRTHNLAIASCGGVDKPGRRDHLPPLRTECLGKKARSAAIFRRMELRGHTILITGGAGGIGLALADALSRRENTVFICGRTAAKLEAARQHNSRLRTIPCDITKEEDVRQALARIRNAGASVSILVNNAAVGHPYSLARDSQSCQKAEQEIATNLLAPIRLTTLLLPTLLQQPAAAILNVTSGFALWPWFIAPGYSASKAGLRAFTLALRVQLRNTRVRVFEALPPLVDTPLIAEVRGKKLPPHLVAERILAGMAKDRLEIVIGKSRLIRIFARLCPGLLQRVLLRYPVKFEEMENFSRNAQGRP